MKLDARGWDAGQQALATNTDIQTIVGAVIRHPSAQMLDLVERAVYFPHSRQPNALTLQLLVKATQVPQEAHPAAYELAEAGVRICNLPDETQKRRRGMLVAALTVALIELRAPCLTEVRVEVAPGDWTNPQDALVDGDPLEVYECKSGLINLDQGDVDEFAAIAHAAEADGRPYRMAVATLHRRSQLATKLEALNVEVDVYSAAREDILDLATQPPTFQVAP